MSIKAIIEYTDPTDFTYDNTKVDISGGKLRLASQVDPSEMTYFNFNTAGDFTPTRGLVPLITTGNVNVQNGMLEFFNSALDTATLAEGAFPTNKGSIHFKYFPNTATVVTPQDILEIKGSLLARNRIHMTNQGGGISRVNWNIIDSSGTTVLTTIFLITLDMINGHDILASWDLDTGNQRLFVDGVQVFSNTATATFTTDSSYELILGKSDNLGNPNYKLDDLQLFSEAIRTDNTPFSVPVEEAFPYPTGEHNVIVNPLITMDAILTFIEDVELNTGGIRYVFRFSSIYYYWDGADWLVSNGTFAQSNIAADIAANLATLPISQGVTTRLEMFITSPTDRYQTPEAESLELSYNFILDPATPVLCNVYGTILDNSGNPVAGAKITFDTEDHFYGVSFIAPKVTVFSDAQGIFSAQVVETQTTGLTATALIEYKEAGKTKKVKYENITIPNDLIARLADIV